MEFTVESKPIIDRILLLALHSSIHQRSSAQLHLVEAIWPFKA
jgi:hypothetical protein